MSLTWLALPKAEKWREGGTNRQSHLGAMVEEKEEVSKLIRDGIAEGGGGV